MDNNSKADNSETLDIPGYDPSIIDEILASDLFTYNKEETNKHTEAQNKLHETKPTFIDKSTEDLLRRMTIHERLSESNQSNNDINSKKINKEVVNKMPPPPPSSGSVPPPPPPQMAKANVPPPPPPKKQIQIPTNILIDETGFIFDLYVTKSTKDDVIKVMNDKSEKIHIEDKTIIYEDLGMTFYFDEYNIISEVTFTAPFKGSTKKGLKLQDDINKAIAIYDQPKIRTTSGAIWKKIAVFLKDEQVTTIRLRFS